MTRRYLALLAALLSTGPLAAAAPPTVAGMKNVRRVLIVAASSAADPRLSAQKRALAGWRRGGRARDVSVVTVIGGRVTGAGDRAKLLRRQWRLPPGEFQVVLVGKDGHEALRGTHPLPAAVLQRTIDAMPMRRAGYR